MAARIQTWRLAQNTDADNRKKFWFSKRSQMKRVLFFIAFLASVAFSQTSITPAREHLIGKSSYIDFLKCSKIEGDLSNLRCDFQLVNNGPEGFVLTFFASNSNYITSDNQKAIGESGAFLGGNREKTEIEAIPGSKILFSVDFSVPGIFKVISKLNFAYVVASRNIKKYFTISNVKIVNPEKFVSFWSEYIIVGLGDGRGIKFRFETCRRVENVSFNLTCGVSYVNLTDSDKSFSYPKATIKLGNGISYRNESVYSDEKIVQSGKRIDIFARSKNYVEFNFSVSNKLKSLNRISFERVDFDVFMERYDLDFINIPVLGGASQKPDLEEVIVESEVLRSQLKYRLQYCKKDVGQNHNLVCKVDWINPFSDQDFSKEIQLKSLLANIKLIDSQGKAYPVLEIDIEDVDMTSQDSYFKLEIIGQSQKTSTLKFSVPENILEFRELRFFDAQFKGKVSIR
jgi:hypothetical protein